MPRVSPSQFRAHALDTSRSGGEASMLTARMPDGSALPVGLIREDAREFFESELFTGGVCTLSVRRGTELAAVLSVIHLAFGPDAPTMLRAVDPMTSNLDFYFLLTDETGFVAPTLLQDAHLARRYNARSLVTA